MGDFASVRELAECLWNGDDKGSPVSFKSALLNEVDEFCDGKILFVNSFANALAIDCGPGGVVLIDSGSVMFAANVHELVCDWRKEKNKGLVQNVIWTHHHVDHVFGVNLYEEEGTVTVYAHKNLPGHFERYRYTNGYNGHINGRQFQAGIHFPDQFRFPNVTYEDKLNLNVGDQMFHLHHGMGETDDATWVYMPKLKAVATGDLFIWCCPNCGNPAKVQRYCREWAVALRQMADYEPEYLFPGHGPPIWGKDRVKLALEETAQLLETIQQQVIDLMNQGKSLDEVIHGVDIPKKLLARPYLRAVYDDPEFIIRNIWRRFGGWFDSFPPSLLPPSNPSLAKGVSGLLDEGAVGLAKKAEKLLESGNDEHLRIARYFADWAALAVEHETNQNKKQQQRDFVNEVRSKVYEMSVEKETSLMAKGVFSSAKLESEGRLAVNQGQELLKAHL